MRKTVKGGGEAGARASGREHLITMSEPPRGQAEARVPPAFAFPVNVDVGLTQSVFPGPPRGSGT